MVELTATQIWVRIWSGLFAFALLCSCICYVPAWGFRRAGGEATLPDQLPSEVREQIEGVLQNARADDIERRDRELMEFVVGVDWHETCITSQHTYSALGGGFDVYYAKVQFDETSQIAVPEREPREWSPRNIPHEDFRPHVKVNLRPYDLRPFLHKYVPVAYECRVAYPVYAGTQYGYGTFRVQKDTTSGNSRLYVITEDEWRLINCCGLRVHGEHLMARARFCGVAAMACFTVGSLGYVILLFVARRRLSRHRQLV